MSRPIKATGSALRTETAVAAGHDPQTQLISPAPMLAQAILVLAVGTSSVVPHLKNLNTKRILGNGFAVEGEFRSLGISRVQSYLKCVIYRSSKFRKRRGRQRVFPRKHKNVEHIQKIHIKVCSQTKRYVKGILAQYICMCWKVESEQFLQVHKHPECICMYSQTTLNGTHFRNVGLRIM